MGLAHPGLQDDTVFKALRPPICTVGSIPQHQRFRERAYALWEREGRPEGNADEYWYRTRAFEFNTGRWPTPLNETLGVARDELLLGRRRQ